LPEGAFTILEELSYPADEPWKARLTLPLSSFDWPTSWLIAHCGPENGHLVTFRVERLNHGFPGENKFIEFLAAECPHDAEEVAVIEDLERIVALFNRENDPDTADAKSTSDTLLALS
jgi:hypothetical protein